MAETAAPEFVRTCAWDGQDRPGKHYILTTTEGQEIVSPEQLRGQERIESLESRVDDLMRQVKRLTKLRGGTGDDVQEDAPKPRKRTSKVPAQAGSAED